MHSGGESSRHILTFQLIPKKRDLEIDTTPDDVLLVCCRGCCYSLNQQGIETRWTTFIVRGVHVINSHPCSCICPR